MKKNLLSTAIRSALGLALVANIAPMALAQEEEGAEKLTEEIVVTGSRIARPSLESSTPLQIVTSADITLGAETNIGEFLNQLPSVGSPLFSRTNSNFDISNSGVVNVDLRDLGVARTLTLVNGRRFVAGVPGSSAVDLNAIPTAMIERVEVTTGGASAVYGSDAIAGVVNFIMKDDFEGVELTSRYEITSEDDGEEYDLGLLIGSNFADDRGNATVFVGYTDQGAVFSRNRDRTDTDAVSSVFFGGGVFEQTEPFFSSFPPQGRFDAGTGTTGTNYTYLPDGTLVDSFDTNGANGVANGFNRMAFRTIAIPTERFLTATNIHYDFSDSLTAFFEGTYTSTTTVSDLEPFPLDSADIFQSSISGGIPIEYLDSSGNLISHPYMPAEILAAVTANAAAAAADDDPNNEIDGVRFRRRLAEFGGRGATNERQTFRFSTGLEGSIAEKWNWDVSYTYGQTTQTQRSEGQVDVTAMRFALLSEADPDNLGSFRCVDAEAREAGCVPLNVFGFNSASQEAIDYISADQNRNAKIEQNIVQANISGDVFELPAGALQFAAGFERRIESSEAFNDALTVRGLNSSNASPNITGQFDVEEFYLELNIPVLRDQLVDYLGFGVAARTSDYSTVGSTSTYEGRMDLNINDNFRVRASSAQAVRAPNVDELFDPGTQTFAQVSDPCGGITAASTGVVADNCLADPGIAQRVADTGAFTLSQTELQGTTGFLGGNPNLFEETSNSFTVGFVHTPTYLPDSIDLSVSVDYWDIEVEDAIFTVTQNNVLDICYNSVGLSSPLCDNVVRFDIANSQRGALDEVNSGTANVGEILTSGVDIDFNMTLDLESLMSVPGEFTWNTVYTFLDEYEVINLPGEDPDNEAGEIGNAKHKWNTSLRYTLNDFTFQWQVRYIHDSRIEDTDFDDEDCAPQTDADGVFSDLDCTTGAVTYSDIQVRYNLSSLLDTDVELFAGVENVFDEDPPIISAGLTDSDTGTETNAGVYDAIGQAWYVGFRAKF